MGDFTISNSFSGIDFIPITQNVKGASLEITLNNNYIFVTNNCDGNNSAYIRTSPTYGIGADGSVYTIMHPNWTKYLYLSTNNIPQSYFQIQNFGMGGCGYGGSSSYLNMPDGTIGAKGTLGYR